MQTNREFLIAILRSEKFLKGATTTDFIEKEKLSREVDLSEEEIKITQKQQVYGFKD